MALDLVDTVTVRERQRQTGTFRSPLATGIYIVMTRERFVHCLGQVYILFHNIVATMLFHCWINDTYMKYCAQDSFYSFFFVG